MSRRLPSLALGLAALVLLGAPVRAAEPAPPGVRVEITDEIGSVFADPQGRTLYTWAYEKPGPSRCDDTRYVQTVGTGDLAYYLPESANRPTCAQIWPAFTAAPGSAPVGKWSIVERKDGSRQWAYGGKPVYTYVHDQMPGQISGVGGDLGRFLSGRTPISVADPAPGGVKARMSAAGWMLATTAGEALYWRVGEPASKPVCKGDCLQTWKPLTAPAIAEAPAGWSIVRRPDGVIQWAYKGRLLYRYLGDRNGEMNGVDQPRWQAAALHPPTPTPEGVTRSMTPDGLVFADRRGMTLYSFGCVDEAPDRLLCDIPGATQTYRRGLCGSPKSCIDTWRPLVAGPEARPAGRTWTIVEVDPTGARQYADPGQPGALRVWAYRGKPVYTYAGDKRPGDMNGHSIRALPVGVFGMLRADGAGPYRGF